MERKKHISQIYRNLIFLFINHTDAQEIAHTYHTQIKDFYTELLGQKEIYRYADRDRDRKICSNRGDINAQARTGNTQRGTEAQKEATEHRRTGGPNGMPETKATWQIIEKEKGEKVNKRRKH